MGIESTREKDEIAELLEAVKLPKQREWAREGLSRKILRNDDLSSERLTVGYRQWLVAVHEVGHELAARYYSWWVLRESVIPCGNTLGVTEVKTGFGKLFRQIVRERIYIGWGGFAARFLIGHGNPADGTGADFAQIRALNGGSLSGSEGSFKAVNSFGVSYLNDRSWQLFDKKVLVET